MGDCPFCEILAGRAPATIARRWDDAIALHPLGPVTPGHLLIVPRQHVADFGEDPDVSAATMRRAAEYVQGQEGAWNVITSRGRLATQSVWHLHLHLVPRRENDRLALPWHSGKHTKGARTEGGPMSGEPDLGLTPARARVPDLIAEVERLREERDDALAVVARIREVRPTYAEWEHRAIVAEHTVSELLATSPTRETYDLTNPRNPRREGQACDKLYVWRSLWGYWVVSTAPKARHATGSGRSYHRSQPEAFADAWARTHPKEET